MAALGLGTWLRKISPDGPSISPDKEKKAKKGSIEVNAMLSLLVLPCDWMLLSNHFITLPAMVRPATARILSPSDFPDMVRFPCFSRCSEAARLAR